VTELDDGLHDHLTQSLPTPGSPTTSEDSSNPQAVTGPRISPNGSSATTSLPVKIINPALLKALSESQNANHPDSDATTEEENHTNTRQEATETTIDNSHQPLKPTFSSIFTSPTFMERIEKEITEATPVSATSNTSMITKSPTSSHKKARFNDEFSPKLTRQRSYTFSTAAEYTQTNGKAQTSGLDALSWLASIAESEVNAVKSLYSLSHSHDLIAEGDEQEDDNQDEEEEEQDDGEEGDDEEVRTPKEGGVGGGKGAVRYLDPYLVNESNSEGKILSKPRSRANSHVEENNNSSSEAFGGVSYFQSFQKQQAEGWSNNHKSSFHEPMMINSADRLSLLTSSAGLIASPMSKRVLLDEDNNNNHNLTIKLPFRRPSISSSGTTNTVTTSSTNSNQLNYHHGNSSSAVMSESHYLDMEDMQGMNPNGGGKLLYPGRARAASMSLLESSNGVLTAGFDHPALARIKGNFHCFILVLSNEISSFSFCRELQ
jgi:hypothetical protein